MPNRRRFTHIVRFVKGEVAMNVKRLLNIGIALIIVFGFVFFAGPVKAAGVWNSVAQITTYDNSMCQEKWGKITATRNVTITDQGGGFYLVTFADDGTLVTLGTHSPGGNCTTSFVGAGVFAHWTGGQSVVVQGVLKNPVPSSVTVDYTNDNRANKYFLAFFDSVASVNYVSWGWDYVSCGNGAWHDNDASESAWNSQGPNSLMGDIIGAPAACQLPASGSAPQSCTANSDVLFAYVGRKVHINLVQPGGLVPLQHEARYSTFVESAKLPDGKTPSGKISLVFYPDGSAWRQFEGKELLITVDGYKDGWYWYPKLGANGQLFCDWKPVYNVGK